MTPETTTFAAVLAALLAVLIGTDAPGSFITALLRLRSGRRQGLSVICAWLAKLRVPRREREELAQQVVLEALETWHTFDPKHRRPRREGHALFAGWLNTITVRAASDHLQRAQQRAEVPTPYPIPEEMPDPTPLAPELLEVEERRRQLVAHLAALDRELRAVLTGHDLDGLPMAEVAKRQGISKWTAYRLRALALGMLQVAMGAARNRRRRRRPKSSSALRLASRRRCSVVRRMDRGADAEMSAAPVPSSGRPA